MFVSKSKYENERLNYLRAELRNLELMSEYNSLMSKYNALIDRINAKGGEEFLGGKASTKDASFTKEEVNILLRLCHPDKHNGKRVANDITTRLIMLRKTL